MTKLRKKIIKKISKAIIPRRKPAKRKGFSEETKKATLRFQRYECATFRCRNKRFLEFDHIKGRSDNSIENCQALCPTCHRRKSRYDGRKTQFARKIRRGRK